LLLGKCGLLNSPANDAYMKHLANEYNFLCNKYRLLDTITRVQLLRMRPANFPTIRIAQLAMILHSRGELFNWLQSMKPSLLTLRELQVKASSYWDNHYVPNEISKHHPKWVGRQMAENLMVNSIAPLLFAYGIFSGENQWKEQAVGWLEILPPEKNKITRYFSSAGLPLVSSACTQAALHLFRFYCSEKRCLDCAVGNTLLNREGNVVNNIECSAQYLGAGF